MQLSNYISDLLYRYQCVIVPEFGGFVSKEIPAVANHYQHTFYPPSKKIGFNSQLSNNDGLLANYIADVENISFDQALNKINTTVSNWKNRLENESVVLEKIGVLSKNTDQKITFEPLEKINYLTSSFGLTEVKSPAIKREVYTQKTIAFSPAEEKSSRNYFKYAATIAVLLTVGALGWKNIRQNQVRSLESEYQEKVTRKIQEATFVISNPLPEITLDVVKTKLPKKYHLIAGAFSEAQNATKKVNQLKRKGFDASILGKNKWGLTQVTFESFTTREEAVSQLKIIKKTIDSDAWLFIK